MKSIIFDTGPIISLATNNLLWLLEELKNRFKGEFYITEGVKSELIDRPLKMRRFKFEAIQVLSLIEKGVIKIIPSVDLKDLANELMDKSNHSFKMRGHWMRIIQYAEMEVLAAAIKMSASAVVFDERTARMMVEEHDALSDLFKHKFREMPELDEKTIGEFKELTKGVKVLRSIELVIVAYENRLLDKFLTHIPDPDVALVDSFLWALKLRGAAISRREIEKLVKLEKNR